MSKKVRIENFAGEVMKITQEYADEVEDQTEAAVIKTAFKAEDDLHVEGKFEDRS